MPQVDATSRPPVRSTLRRPLRTPLRPFASAPYWFLLPYWFLRPCLCLLSCLSLPPFAATAAAEPAPPRRVTVFVSGEEGYHTFRIPALVVTPQGALLAICEGRKTNRADHGDVDLVYKRSADGGRTWGPLRLLYEEGATALTTIGNPCPVVDQQTGIIWLPFTRDNDAVLLTSSDDDGQSWSAPRNITTQVKKKTWQWYATGPGNGIQLQHGAQRGRLIIPCDHRLQAVADRQEASHSHIFYSDDHGATWQLGGAAASRTNECAVVELSRDRLMLNMRSFRGTGKRAVAISQDGGLTWGETQDDPILIEPCVQASLLRYIPGTAQSPSPLLFVNPATTQGRHHLTVRWSGDEGRTWPVQRLLEEGSAAYSSLAQLPDGPLGVLYERADYGQIGLAVFTLDWLSAEAPQ